MAPRRVVTLHGDPIVWKIQIRHLGNIVTSDLSDSEDIKLKRCTFISQVNKLNDRFGSVSSNIKSRLLQTYCCSWYGCQTWDLVSKPAHQMSTEWNKAVRRTLRIPYCTLLPLVTGSPSFKSQHKARIAKFISSFLQSKNEHVNLIGLRALQCTNGSLGRNWVRCRSGGSIPLSTRSYVPVTDPQDVFKARGIRDLLDVRDGISTLDIYTSEDITHAIQCLCCG